MRAKLGFVAALGAVACGPAPHTRGAGAVAPLAVTPVVWNAARAPIGKVRGVADDGAVVAVFADDGASVFSSGARVAQDRSVTDWKGAASITAPADGGVRWLVGVGGNGRLYYVRAMSQLEDVTERYGLGAAKLLGVTSLGPKSAGFLLPGEVAFADGRRVTRYASPGIASLAGVAGFGAGVGQDAVELFDAAKGTHTRYALEGATHAAVGADGKLYATTKRGVYVATGGGDLQLVYDAEGDTVHGLVMSGGDAWFVDGPELGVIEAAGVAETSGAKIGADAELTASPSGDVWVLAGGGLDRYARARPPAAPGAASPSGTAAPGAPSTAGAWATLGPVFARSCSACHLPNGESGTDLSNAGAWESERDEIRVRVLERGSMPPSGHTLSDADRAAIRAWVAAPKPAQ